MPRPGGPHRGWRGPDSHPAASEPRRTAANREDGCRGARAVGTAPRTAGAGRRRGRPARTPGESRADRRRGRRTRPAQRRADRSQGGASVAGNKAVMYMGPGKVEVADLDYPGLELKEGPGVNPANVGRKTPHGVILKTVSTNICGSDQHMVRGRTTAPERLVLGHEITGEIIEKGSDVEFLQVGDIVSV